jgi:hypothetical protein
MAMVSAVETQPGTNPDRASFTTALETARDQLVVLGQQVGDTPLVVLDHDEGLRVRWR